MRRNERSQRGSAAVIYCRISSDAEGEGLGVERQERDCRDLARLRGLEVIEVFVDNDVSASPNSKKPRPRYEEMIRRAERGEFAAILYYSSSRLTRKPREYERVIDLVVQTGIRLHSVVSGDDDLTTADGQTMARMRAAMDAGEALRISERIRRKVQERAEKGLWAGGSTPPFGYEIVPGEDGRGMTIQLVPERARLLRQAAERVLAGESLYGVITDWNGRGVRTGQGNVWRPKTLRQSLLNPAAAGKRRSVDRHGVERYHDAAWEPALDGLTWNRLHDLLDDPSRTRAPRDGSYAAKTALGGGLTVCGGVYPDGTPCGRKLMRQPRKRGGVTRARLVCLRQATGGCGRVTVDADHLEEFVLRLVWEVLDTPNVREALTAASDTGEDAELRAAIRDLDEQLYENYRRSLARGADDELFKRAESDLREERGRLERRLADVMAGLVLGSLDDADIARERYEAADVPWRRAFLGSLIRSVTVLPFPEGVAGSVARRKADSDGEHERKVREHRAATMRRRVEIDWRA